MVASHESPITSGDGAALRSALRKARLRLIPLLAICYLVAFMDRANISFAAETMNRDLGFSARQYGLGAGLFFLSYALCEIPANRMLLRIGPRRWLGGIMLVWGVLAACMLFVHSARSFYGFRLALGAAEAGYFPGALFYLSQWFPSTERARSISLFYIAFPLSSTVMGSAAGALLRLNGLAGLRGWQWLFLVEALPAIALSFVLWTWLPAGPAETAWLSARERAALERALVGQSNSVEVRVRESSPGALVMDLDAGSGTPESRAPSGLREALRSGRAWTLSLMLFFTLGSYYAVTFSLPTVLGLLTHRSAGSTGWMVALFGVAGALAMLLVARSSDRRRERRWHIVVPTLLMVLALLVTGLSLGSDGQGWRSGVAVAALLVAITSYYAMQGPLMGLPNLLLRGEAAAVAIAMLTMGGVAGGFVGPYWVGWMKDRTGGYAGAIGWLAAPCVLAVICTLGLLRGVEETSPGDSQKAR